MITRWTSERHFVDKTKLIKEFLRTRHKAVMVCAPQGFLKTSNLEMIASFLSLENNSDEKENRRFNWRHLNIMKSVGLVNRYFCEYPVVFIPSAPMGTPYTIDYLLHATRLAFWCHKDLIHSERLSERQKDLFKLYSAYKYDLIGTCQHKLADALKTLCELLQRHYNKRVYVFIDNFDYFLLEAMMRCKPLINIEPILQRMLTGLCGSPAVKRVFLTGITSLPGCRRDIARLQDLKIYKFLDGHKFTKYFGLTEKDIRVLANMNLCSIEITDNLLRNGYRTIKRGRIYSPEWVHDFLQHSRIDNPIWFEEIFQKHNLQKEIEDNDKIRKLVEGNSVKVNGRVMKNALDLMQLNRLLNGSYEGPMDEEEIDLMLAFLHETGVLSFVDHSNLKLPMDCWISNPEVKLCLSATSRIGAVLRRLVSPSE